MKIRKGFVSNSSSSSFIVAGRYIETERDFHKLLKDEPENVYLFTDRWGSEGEMIYSGQELIDYPEITYEMLRDFTLVTGVSYVDEDILDILDFPVDAEKLFITEKDYHNKDLHSLLKKD